MQRIAHMATFPPRKRGMLRRIDELLPQVDRLRVYANGYTETPAELTAAVASGKLDFVVGKPDMGSQGKLYWLDEDRDSYYLTVDDDIYYPGDYVDSAIAQLERFARRAVLSYHGGRFMLGSGNTLPHNRRLKDIRALYAYYKTIPIDRCVHMTGNGCMICHPLTIGLDTGVITGPLHSGDDEDIALWTQEHAVPAIVLAHYAGWLKPDNEHWQIGAMHTDRAKQEASDTKLRQRQVWNLNPYHGAPSEPV